VIASEKPKNLPTVPISPSLVQLLRSRKFNEVIKVADSLPTSERKRPEIRLAIAFALLRSGAPERVKGELIGVAEQAPLLSRDINQVLAEAELASRASVVSSSPKESSSSAPSNNVDRLSQVRKAADDGQIALVDEGVAKLLLAPQTPLSKAEGDYLRGKARFVARREQREGAELLGSAADRGFNKPAQLRFDAARLYVREGDAEAATKMYLRVATSDRTRADEALYYAGRTQATLGSPTVAAGYYAELLRRYKSSRYADEARYERALNLLSLGRNEPALTSLKQLVDDPKYESNRSILAHLTCLAMARSSKIDAATECLKKVIDDYPVHLAGLFARARLGEHSIAVKSRAKPPAPVDKQLDESVFPRVKQLFELGLDELATMAFEANVNQSKLAVHRDLEWQCRHYGVIGFGGRGYAISSDLRDRVRPSEEVNAKNRWLFDCRFPTPYGTLVVEFEKRFALPDQLLFAVMRQESGFRPTIASNAKAVGLMQLLPETAERVAQEFSLVEELATNQTGAVSSKLTEPRVNLALGAAYLRKLLDYFDGNLILAVAAYNAGPKTVALWVGRAGEIPMELFVARIPYAETRNYVERVLMNLAMYRYLRDGDEGVPSIAVKLPKELKLSESLY
jgi:soluble lytic murein transglycosylase